MKTIVIKYGGQCIKEISFPDNRKGNSDSVKFIQELFNDRKKHPYFYMLDKIKSTESKLADRNLGPRTKKRFRLEVDLRFYKEERQDILEIAGLPDKMPEAIKIKICKE